MTRTHLYRRIRYFVADIRNDTVTADLEAYRRVSFTEAEEMALRRRCNGQQQGIGTIEEYRYRVTDNREQSSFLDNTDDLSTHDMLSLIDLADLAGVYSDDHRGVLLPLLPDRAAV